MTEIVLLLVKNSQVSPTCLEIESQYPTVTHVPPLLEFHFLPFPVAALGSKNPHLAQAWPQVCIDFLHSAVFS